MKNPTLILASLSTLLIVVTSANAEVREENSYCELYNHLKGGDKVGTCHINAEGQEETIWQDRVCPKSHSGNRRFFLSLFVILAWGALVRTFLRATKLNIPYTVILMLTGLIVGLGTRVESNIHPLFQKSNPDGSSISFCSVWSGYTKIARIHPKIILYIFLPVLIFESAFNMKVHVFMKSAWQILMVALPGMLITTFITAAVSQLFMQSYHWTFAQACLFGSIISATDPVAVVAILRELGISDTLSTMIEGESLLNDGIAIVLYEVFKDIVQAQSEGNIKIWEIFIKFLSIGVGGPLLGILAAKTAVTTMSLIFNDATVEICITIVAAYTTYYFGEALGFSGVVAVVILGLRMNANSTCISPGSEKLVHHFWEMLGYFANTVLFVLVGIVISETAINQISMLDVIYLLVIYVFLNLIRLLMLTLLMPLLSRIGYGLKWREMIVMMWGGLRGAVGLCLALEVYRTKELCLIDQDRLGPKILFLTAGIVILTLLVNGTSTRLLLNCLKMDEVSQGRIQELKNAMKHVTAAQMRALAVQKQVRFLADANWDLVDQYTRIHSPLEQKKITPATVTKVISAKLESEFKFLKRADIHKVLALQNKEVVVVEELMEDARLRILKALKIFYWRQFSSGVLTDSATQILTTVTETVEDSENAMIKWENFSNHWRAHGPFNWLKKHLVKNFIFNDVSTFLEKPSNRKWNEFRIRHPFWWLATRHWFDGMMHCIAIVNTIPVISEVVLQFKSLVSGPSTNRSLAFFAVNILFALIYTLEFLVKVFASGWRNYWMEERNFIDVTLILLNYIDIAMTLVFGQSQIGLAIIIALVLRLGFRTVSVIRPLLPRVYFFIDSRTKQSLFLGYDIGTGFVAAIDDVLKFLPQITQHPKVFPAMKASLEHERSEALMAMANLQKDYPQIAIGVKTRQASRTVLNQMHETLDELIEDGLLDEKDSEVLDTVLEERMKAVQTSPSSITPPTPESILGNVTWILGNSQLAYYISEHAILKTFDISDKITTAGEPPDGVYVIVSGMVKMDYTPSDENVAAKKICGQIPNKDFFKDLTFEEDETDLFTTGTVIGELGVLTGQRVAATVTCETAVTAYHISDDDMRAAVDMFNQRIDSLESRIWRSCGFNIAAALLPSESAFQAWTTNKIRMHLERSAVVVPPANGRLTIPDFIANVILLHGHIMDYQTREIFIAPCVLPHTATKLTQCENSIIEGRVMLVAHEEIDFYEHEPQRPCSGHHVHEPEGNSSAKSTRSISSPLASEIRMDRRQRRLSIALNLWRPSKPP